MNKEDSLAQRDVVSDDRGVVHEGCLVSPEMT